MPPLKFAARSRTEALLLFFGAGLAAFLALLFWLAWAPGPLLHPGAYGWTAFGLLHLDVLGWISTVMFGAYLNLIPVIMQPAKVTPRLAKALFAPYVLGVAGLVVGFATSGGMLLAAGATFLVVTVVAQALHLAWAAWLSARGKVSASPTALAFMVAPLFLAELAVIGFLMAVALGAPGLVAARVLSAAPAHMAAGLGGWLALTVMGAAYRLVPLFFTTARGHDHARFGAAAVSAVAVGNAFLQIRVFWTQSMVAGTFGTTGDVLIAIGSVLFFADIVRMVRHRSHRLGDSVTYLTLAGFANLAAALLIAAAVHGATGRVWSSVLFAALYLGLFAAPSLLIIGQLSRILVFLTTLDLAEWARDHGGVRKTWNLGRPALLKAGFWFFQIGVAAVVADAGLSGGWHLGRAVLRGALVVQAAGGVLMCISLLPPFVARRNLRKDAPWLKALS